MLSEIKRGYQMWLSEQEEQPSQEEVENYFCSVQYRYLVDMQHAGASNEKIGSSVKALNNFIENEVLPVVELERCRGLYKIIAEQSEPDRTRRLSDLIDVMQRMFRIPLLNNEEYNKENPGVIKLYREISAARDI